MGADQIRQGAKVGGALGRAGFKGIGGGAQRGGEAGQKDGSRIGGGARRLWGGEGGTRPPPFPSGAAAQRVGMDSRQTRQNGHGLPGAPARRKIEG